MSICDDQAVSSDALACEIFPSFLINQSPALFPLLSLPSNEDPGEEAKRSVEEVEEEAGDRKSLLDSFSTSCTILQQERNVARTLSDCAERAVLLLNKALELASCVLSMERKGLVLTAVVCPLIFSMKR